MAIFLAWCAAHRHRENGSFDRSSQHCRCRGSSCCRLGNRYAAGRPRSSQRRPQRFVFRWSRPLRSSRQTHARGQRIVFPRHHGRWSRRPSQPRRDPACFGMGFRLGHGHQPGFHRGKPRCNQPRRADHLLRSSPHPSARPPSRWTGLCRRLDSDVPFARSLACAHVRARTPRSCQPIYNVGASSRFASRPDESSPTGRS